MRNDMEALTELDKMLAKGRAIRTPEGCLLWCGNGMSRPNFHFRGTTYSVRSLLFARYYGYPGKGLRPFCGEEGCIEIFHFVPKSGHVDLKRLKAKYDAEHVKMEDANVKEKSDSPSETIVVSVALLPYLVAAIRRRHPDLAKDNYEAMILDLLNQFYCKF